MTLCPGDEFHLPPSLPGVLTASHTPQLPGHGSLHSPGHHGVLCPRLHGQGDDVLPHCQPLPGRVHLQQDRGGDTGPETPGLHWEVCVPAGLTGEV
jgi:hypothetical protein